MTWDEYLEWYKHHAGLYTSLDSWMAKQPKGEQAAMESWWRILDDADLDEAMRASLALAKAPEESQPKGFDNHPRRIRQMARESSAKAAKANVPAPRDYDGHQAYRCLQCHDDGTVLVWGEKSVNHMISVLRAGVDDGWLPEEAFNTGEMSRWNGEPRKVRRGIYRMVTACTCQTGSRHRRNGLPTYDENFALIHGKDMDQEIRLLAYWVAERLGPTAPRQLQAF